MVIVTALVCFKPQPIKEKKNEKKIFKKMRISTYKVAKGKRRRISSNVISG